MNEFCVTNYVICFTRPPAMQISTNKILLLRIPVLLYFDSIFTVYHFIALVSIDRLTYIYST